MSAVISHEIRNPLDAIQNILYLVQTDPTASGAISELANQAQQEVARVMTISRSMLSFHRESAMPELVNLRSVAESVCFLLQGLIQERGIEFKIVGEDACEIEALPGETRQVMLNLARNACEATTRPGCTVTLEFARVSDGVEFQVTDQGCGIDPQIQAALFEFGKSTKGRMETVWVSGRLSRFAPTMAARSHSIQSIEAELASSFGGLSSSAPDR